MKKLASVIALVFIAATPALSQSLEDLKNDGKNTRQRAHLRHGLQPEPLQHAQADQPADREAAGAGMEHFARQQLRRAGAAAGLRRRHVRDQRANTRSRSTSPPASSCGARRSIGTRRRRASCAAAFRTRGRRSTTARCIAARSTRTSWRSTRRPASRCGRARSPSGRRDFRSPRAPMVANGVLITGISGAEFGVRGFLDGLDPETGKQLWRRYTIPAPGEKGSETWPQGRFVPARRRLDLDHRFLRSGTRSASTGASATPGRGSRAGGRATTCIPRRCWRCRPKTGEIVWHYQLVPNEMFDLDATWEWILADIDVEGVKRKVTMHFSRGGFLYVIDRTNGELLSAKPFEKVNWATHVDMADRPAGRIGGVEERARRRADRIVARPVGRQELGARGVQSRDRPALRQHHAQLASGEVRAGRIQGRPALRRPGEPARAARGGHADRARRRRSNR